LRRVVRIMSVGGCILIVSKEMRNKMFEDLTPCPECNSLGMLAPNIWGKTEFVHKVPSPRLEGYFTFVAECQNK
jgi:hypothetical protein